MRPKPIKNSTVMINQEMKKYPKRTIKIKNNHKAKFTLASMDPYQLLQI